MKARAPKRRVYGGLSSDERRGERRERLIAAGLRLFGTKGYARTSIGQLCTAARVTARHFYEEFKERETLLFAVYDRIVDEARKAVLRELATAPDDPHARVRAGIGALVHVYLHDPRYVRIACIEVVGVSPTLEKHRRSVIREFAGIIASQAAQLAERGVLEQRDFSMVGTALAGATNELLIEWVLSDAQVSPQAITDELAALFSAAATAGTPSAPPASARMPSARPMRGA